MTLRAPLAVRIDDGVTDRHVTASTSNLRWRKAAPGGYVEASMTVNLDPYNFTDLGAADRLWVYGADGRVLFEGFLDYPGNLNGPAGRALDLTAMGTQVLTQDRSQNLVYIDRDLSKWQQNKASTNAPSAVANAGDDPTVTSGGATTQGLFCQFQPGQPIGTGAVAQIGYSALVDASMELGALTFTIIDGPPSATGTGYRTDYVVSAGTGTAVQFTIGGGLDNTTNPRGPVVRYVGAGGSFAPGNNRVALQLRRSGGATTVASDDVYAFFYEVAVCGRRVDMTGALVSAAGMTAATYTQADWVVTDLLGRVLTGLIDTNASTVEATTFQIDQLAYHDGARMGQVLDDLALWHPDYLWEMLENTGAGWRFNYRAWPTTARYEVSTRDGFEQTGGDVDLCNRQVVTWTDNKGRPRSTVVTAASSTAVGSVAGVTPTVFATALSALEQAGRVRDAEPIDLPDGFGSAANAQRIGEQALTSAATLPTAARLTVRKPVADLLRGGMAAPYEIEPGYLVRVRETGDLLRLTEMEYDDDAGEATLTLGTPVLTTEQRIARLSKVRPRRRAA